MSTRRSLWDEDDREDEIMAAQRAHGDVRLAGELLPSMATVMKVCGPYGVWSARAQGSSVFGHGGTALEAMQSAVSLSQQTKKRRTPL